MTLEEYNEQLVKSFIAFCRTVIHNEAVNAHRQIAARAKKEIPLSTLSHSELSKLFYEDNYRLYRKTYYVQGNPVHVYDQPLGEVLQYLSPQRRDVILMTYFLNYSDTDIARLLRISNPTVNDRKKAALKKLRELLEEIDDAEMDHPRNRTGRKKRG